MKTQTSPIVTSVPPAILNRFSHFMTGVLSGFDRLRLRGTLRHLFQPTVMEAYLNGNIEVEKVALTEDGTPLGSTGAVAKEIFVGITELPEITVEGLYDDTATTGPDAVFGAIGTSQTVVVTYGGTKTTTEVSVLASTEAHLAGALAAAMIITRITTGIGTSKKLE